MKLFAPLILIALSILPLNMAQAAVITNLSSKPQVVEVEQYGGFAPVSIAAGETYRMPGKLVVRFGGRVMYMEDYDEYAIWGDNDFGPQHREHPGTGGGGF